MEWSTYILIYLGICYTTFRFPWLLHKRLPELKKDSKESKLWIIAHRGGSYEKPENTLEAFDNSKYADMLELDVVGTKDNIVVVSHDSNMYRLTGHNLDMSTLPYSELPPYKKTFFSHFLEEDFQCDREYHYTTLESVFARFPHNYISVDIKSPTEETILEVKRLASNYNRAENTVNTIQFIGSGNKKNNDLVRKHISNALSFMTLEKVLLIYFSYLFGLVGFIPITENSMCVPIMTKTFDKLKYSELPYFKAFI